MPPTEPAAGTSYRDQSGRLAFFGLLTILLGAGCVLLGLAHLLLPVLRGLLPDPDALVADGRSVLMGFSLYGMLGAILIWAGIGSVRKRRWVPPVMRIVSWIWLAGGVLVVALVAGMLDDLLALSNPGGEPWPAHVERLAKAFVLGVTVVAGLLLPTIYLFAYRHRDVSRTCEAHDSFPGWVDRCPTPVLGLAVLLVLAALFLVPLVFRPVVPLFGLLVTGWGGALLTVAGAAASALLAGAIYRLWLPAWWATSWLMILLGVSVAITCQVVPPVEFFRAMGYPEQQLELLGSSGIWWRILGFWGSVILTLLSLGYMIAIRRHFVRRTARPA